MKFSQRTTETGSGLIIAAGAIALLSLMVGSYFLTLIPKYRSVHQSTSWREAQHAAQGGVNYALQTLNQFAASGADPDSYSWSSDWSGNSWSFTTAEGDHILNNTALPVFGGRDNSGVSDLRVDVYTREPGTNRPWFRIRSSGRADVPGKLVSADRRDADLRRMALGASTSHITRILDVVAKPKSQFPRAITTVRDLTLGNSSNWIVDSFDSSDTAKSDTGTIAGGVYPSTASKQQSNGGIATQKAEPTGTLYGPLIDGNGAVVKGDVQTIGGDDPATSTHENISGSGGMDQSRISDNFDDDVVAKDKPNWPVGVTAPPAGNTGFATGSKSSPKRYVINGNLGAFAVTAPASGTGYVEILVNGNIDIGNGNGAAIVIPPNVYATVYVDGNVDFGNGDVNTATGNSKVASHFVVYGVSTAVNPTYTASGNAEQTLVFYGPNYAVNFNGTVDTYGAVVGKSFGINGGGNGGFHYDESLSQSGPISGWAVAGYFEDARADVQ